MRNGTLVLLMAALSARAAFGQNAPFLIQAPATKLEAFATRKGVVIATETYFAGSVSGDVCSVRLQAVILYDAAREADKIRGLRVDIREGQRKDEREVISYVDFDELDRLSKAIASLLDLNRKGSSLPNPIAKELSFSTIGGLTLSMVQRETDRQLLITHALAAGSVCVLNRAGAIDELKMAIDKVVQAFP